MPSGYFSRRVHKTIQSRRIFLAAVVLVTVANFYPKGELATPVTTEAEKHQLVKRINGAKSWIHSERWLLQELSSEWRTKDDPSYTVAKDQHLRPRPAALRQRPWLFELPACAQRPSYLARPKPARAHLAGGKPHSPEDPGANVRCGVGLSSAEDIPTRLCAHGIHALVFISIFTAMALFNYLVSSIL